MATRVTKRELFGRVYTVLANAGETELAEFIGAELTRLNKRAAAPKTLTKAQRENVAVKQAIVNVLAEAEEPLRATAIAKELGISVQKATALLRQLVEAKAVIREAEGKVVTFRVE